MFFRPHRFPPPNKADRHDITETLFKVVLSTINQTKANPSFTMRIMASRLLCDSLFLELVHMSFNMAQIVNSGKTCLRKCIFIDLYTLVSGIMTSGSHLSESEWQSYCKSLWTSPLFALCTCCWMSFEAVLGNIGYFFSIILRIMQHRDIFIFKSIGYIRVFHFINCFPFLIASDSTRYQTM